MIQIPYINAIRRILCVELAKFHKKNFSTIFLNNKLKVHFRNKKVSTELFSLVGEKSIEDFLLCITSFCQNVGLPPKWTIYSDGTILEETYQKIKKLYPFIEMLPWDFYIESVRDPKLDEYVNKGFIFAKKLYVIIGHPPVAQTIYTDSDIVYYKNAGLYFDNHLLDSGIWCCAEALFSPIKHTYDYPNDTLYHINAGFFVYNSTINFKPINEYFKNLSEKDFNHFTELKAVEFMLKQQNYKLLDPRLFVIECNDQFIFGSYFDKNVIAFRHFITPVRHKMWQYGYKWHLK